MATKKKPSAAQLAARAKFVEMVRAKAKAKKSAKVAPKKSASHKDTKSHNVNIRVVSGISDMVETRNKLEKNILLLIKSLDFVKSQPKSQSRNIAINARKKAIAHYKKMLAKQNTLISQSLK